MTTVIGVDLSLSGTGLVTWRDGRMYVATISTSPRDPAPKRHHEIVMRILSMVDKGSTIAAVEERITPGEDAVQTAMDLAELHGVVQYGLWTQGVPVANIFPTTLKLYATGHGKASKADMLVAARGRLERVAYVHDDNEADALWLAAMAMHHYGAPLCPMPTKNLRALHTPTWPAFTLEGP